MLEHYTEAFSRYLRTGEAASLARFCTPGADPARLAVYRNGFFKACGGALRSNYPSVERVVGEACFSALARGYVERYPPRLASLIAYGEDFPRFLGDAFHVHRLACLASIAALDRAWLNVYFAPGGRALEASALAALPEEAILSLRCRLIPAARLVTVDFAALEGWAALRRGELRHEIEILEVSQQVLIWRAGEGVSHRGVGAAEHAFVERIEAGGTCGEAAGAALALDPAFEVGETFAALLVNHLLTGER